MIKDKYKTEVSFRIDKTGLFALFPYVINDFKGNVMSYQHLGQHSGANYDYCIKNSRRATKKEYKDLKKELENIGYNLKIVYKRNYNRYLDEWRKL